MIYICIRYSVSEMTNLLTIIHWVMPNSFDDYFYNVRFKRMLFDHVQLILSRMLLLITSSIIITFNVWRSIYFDGEAIPEWITSLFLWYGRSTFR